MPRENRETTLGVKGNHRVDPIQANRSPFGQPSQETIFPGMPQLSAELLTTMLLGDDEQPHEAKRVAVPDDGPATDELAVLADRQESIGIELPE